MNEEQIKARTIAYVDMLALELASASDLQSLETLRSSWLDKHEKNTPEYRISEVGLEQSIERGKKRLAQRRAAGIPDTFTHEEREQMIEEKTASTIKGLAEAKARQSNAIVK